MAVPLKDKLFVLLQFLVFFAYLLDFELLQFISLQLLAWIALLMSFLGFLLILIAFLQLNTNLSPFPSPRQGAKLISGGAFSFSRHPIYTGVLLMGFGIGLYLGSGYKILVTFLLFLVFLKKSQYEEQKLQEKFPQYSEYKKRTGRFLPKI